MRIGVKIMPREVILDTQGRAVEQTLALNGQSINKCRVGRFVELDLPGDQKRATQQAHEIAQFVLHNPLIETYEIVPL